MPAGCCSVSPHIGLDIGGSLAKLVVFRPDETASQQSMQASDLSETEIPKPSKEALSLIDRIIDRMPNHPGHEP